MKVTILDKSTFVLVSGRSKYNKQIAKTCKSSIRKKIEISTSSTHYHQIFKVMVMYVASYR